MKIFLGTDHAGLEFKNELINILKEEGHEVVDCGPYEYDSDDDYPDYIGKAAQLVSENNGSIGIVMGGSGQGEQMTANKYKGVRCALFYGPVKPEQSIDISGSVSEDPFEIIKLTRSHNDANMLSLGIRFLSKEDAMVAVKLFIKSPFSEEERHIRRIKKIQDIENN